MLLKYLNNPPPQVHHDLTCYNNFRWGEQEEAEQDENRGGVCCKGRGCRDGVKHNGEKNQEDEERGGVMCPCWGGDEYILSIIQICSKKEYEFFFACAFEFER